MNLTPILQVLKKPAVLVGVASVASASAGAILGYRVAERRLSEKFQLIADAEIAEAKEYYSSLRVAIEPKKSPQDILADLHREEATEAAEAHASYQGDQSHLRPVATEEELMGEPPTAKNVFAGKEPFVEDESDLDTWDYELEVKHRLEFPDKPYVIHHDEFFENENDYEQGNLTYYEGDDTLSDDRDAAVPDPEGVVGDDAVTLFGHGSKDKNTVYIRNEALEMDFEIVRSNGKYTVEVLGFDDPDSLKHAHSRAPRKFRESDDE